MKDKFPNLDELTLAAKLRACADGELKGDECEMLRKYLETNPDAAKQMGFEKELRSCCERVLKDQPCCPDTLRSKITAMCGCESTDEAGFTERIDASNEQTRSRSYWMRSSLISAAAAVLVIAAGVLIYQAATFKQIDVPAHLNLQQATYINRVGDFVVREHNRCCNDKAAAAKLVRHDITEATDYFSEAFGMQLVAPELDGVAGEVSFYGGGDCHVPSTSRSGHFRFDATDAAGEQIRLSLFVAPVPTNNLIPMDEGITYKVNSESCDEAGANLFAWQNNGIMYLLVSEASDSMCQTVRDVMRAPTSLSEL
jgi:hypothetical protein